jgi:hypothetical protein
MSRTSARRSGDAYQDIVATSMLVDWLANPGLYSSVQLEADDAGALDDIVATTPEGDLVATQVKFAVASDSYFDWAELLRQRVGKTGSLPSLLERWASSFRLLTSTSADVLGRLITNRPAGQKIGDALDFDLHVDLNRLDDDLRGNVVTACGGDEAAAAFFSNFEFHFAMPSLYQLERDTRARYQQLGGSDQNWFALKEDVRLWILRPEILSEGMITHAVLLRAAGWRPLRGLPQDFPIPGHYEEPESGFIEAIRAHVDSGGVHVLTGGPGTGKSTFLSYLYRKLRDEGRSVVRHHYYLALNQPRTRQRLPYPAVAESLMHDLHQVMPEALGSLAVRSPNAEELREWLDACGVRAVETEHPLLVIVDGLDHAWREERSAAVLEELFDTLLPPPDGVTVLVGTQPLDDRHLPQKLLSLCPKDQWLEVPGLTEDQLRRLVRSSQLWRDDREDRDLDEVCAALSRKTEGNPLHLHYTLSALVEMELPLEPGAIGRLPGCPHRDIVDYYGYLWADLDESARLLLHSVCASEVPWPRDALIDSADTHGSLKAAMGALARVKHLLRSDPLGMRPFHQSLAVYVRDLPDHRDLRRAALESLANWLEEQGTPFHRWAYSWRLQHDLGEDSPLLSGTTLDWARSACGRQFPSNFGLDITAAAREAALDATDLALAVRSALVEDYYGRAFDEGRVDTSEMLAVARLQQDYDDLAPSYRESIPYLPSGHLAWTARIARESGDTEMAVLVLDELNGRLRSTRAEESWDYFAQLVQPLLIAAVNSENVEAERIAEFVNKLGSDDAQQACDVLGRECRRAGLLGRLEAISVGISPTTELAAIERHRVAAAVEQGAWQQVSTSSIFGSAALSLRDGVPQAAEPPRLAVFALEEHLVYRASHQATIALIELFWWALSRGSQGASELDVSGVRSEWLRSFIRHWLQAAESISVAGDASEWIEKVIAMLSLLDVPTWGNDREGSAWLPSVRRGLVEVLLDITSLRVGPQSAARLSANELRSILSSQFVYVPDALHVLLLTRRHALTLDACEELDRVDARGFAGEFNEMALVFSRIAAILATHAFPSDSWVGLSADALVSHGEHKDMLLFQALELAELAISVGVAEGHTWLLSIAPAVATVLDFTDGDETNHLAVEYGGALGRHDPNQLPGFYEWLIDSHRYSAARDVISELVWSGNLDDEIVRSLIHTITEPHLVERLEVRGRRGDSAAAELAARLRQRVPSPVENAGDVAPGGSSFSGEALPSTQEEPADPSQYGLTDLAAFLGTAKYPFDRGVLLSRWLNHWSPLADPEDVLNEIERITKEIRLFDAASGVARFALRSLGFDRAYPWIVRAYRESHGWELYFRDRADAVKWWEQIRTFAPERWLSFAIDTLRSDPGQDPERAFQWNAAVRLAEYTVFMGHPEVAEKLAREFVQLSLELVAPYPRLRAPWLN